MSYAGIGTVFAPPGSPGYKAFWDAKARQCINMADEGTCLAQVARHVPVTISGLGTTFLPPGSPSFKAYWKRRAAACQGVANKGACLSHVAHNVPVTIAGLDDAPGGAGGIVAGLGLTAALITGLVIFGGMSKNPRRRRRSRR
jgi:hypothetical protein